MIELFDSGKADVFAVKVSGKLSKEDYAFLSPAMEAKIKQHGKINLYWEMDHFEGWQPGGLWEDLKFDVKHVNSFKKIAIVGDHAWENLITQLMKPFTTAQVKFYTSAQREEAMIWVNV